jgi:hypothetical protein
MNVFRVFKRRPCPVIDPSALRKTLDWETQQLTHVERQFVKAIASIQPACPKWLREQVLLSLSEVDDLEPTSPLAQAVTVLTLSCEKQANISACDVDAQRELLKALDLINSVVIAAEFLRRLVFDLSLRISIDSGGSSSNFGVRNTRV